MEKFRAVKGYEGIYEVSNLGNLKSLARKSANNKQLKERMLNAGLSSNGYLSVALCKDGICKTYQVHQLVAVAFLGHTLCGYKLVVNHVNHNKQDNTVENLEITTQRSNSNRKHLSSSSKYIGVSLHKKSKKWQSNINIGGKQNHLGLFTEEIKAHEAYQSALTQLA